jgi:hypothetical protein
MKGRAEDYGISKEILGVMMANNNNKKHLDIGFVELPNNV